MRSRQGGAWARALALGAGVWGLAGPASAQIISTSIPRLGNPAAGDKKLAVHLMVSPLARWKYNELFAGASSRFVDVGQYQGRPGSEFLVAGEVVYGGDFNVGVGGWYNRVGKVDYDFQSLGIFLGPSVPGLPAGSTSFNEGTLTGDLTMGEGHVSAFYKNVGLQAGLVRTSSTILDSRILRINGNPTTSHPPLGTISEGTATKSTDWDLFGVVKFAGSGRMPWGLSAGTGIYRKKGNQDTASRGSEDATVFSAFATASVQVFKGLGLDASYWYIGKTKATSGQDIPGDDAGRFMMGVSYTFRR